VPPTLAKGADDVFWVHQLHEALAAHGFYPDDDEAADWFFGDHTANALSLFQARAACAAAGARERRGCPARRLSSVPLLPAIFHLTALCVTQLTCTSAPGGAEPARDRRVRHAYLARAAGQPAGAGPPAGA
jgi:hypothetical protein